MSPTGVPASQVHPKLRILIADDHAVIRRQVRLILEESSHFEVCAEAEDGAEAVKEARRLKPDVVILNVSMPVLNGLEAAREIKAKLPESSIVILSANIDRQFIEEARKIGPAHTLQKPRQERPCSKPWQPL